MDPVTLFATVTAAYNGIKKAAAIGKEVQQVYGQLSKWAESAGQLHDYINGQVVKKPGLFSKGKQKSATAEAFDNIAAKARLIQMEKEIKEMFYYGELQELGESGYRDFILMRKQIREKREKEIQLQAQKRRELIETMFWGIFGVVVIGFILGIVYVVVVLSN